MEFAITQHNETSARKKARIITILLLLLMLIFLFIPIFSYTFPPPEQPGILIAFGEFDAGGDELLTEKSGAEKTDEESAASDAVQKDEIAEPSEQNPSQQNTLATLEEQSEEQTNLNTGKKSEKINQIKTSNPSSTDLRKIEAKKKAELEAAQLAQRQKEEQERKAFEEAKKKEFSDLMKSGQGDGTKSKQEGDPAGNPDSNKLKELNTGTSQVGGGLANRGLLYEPDINENSQKIGRVVVRVCVNGAGKVIEYKFTQQGSTTTERQLVQVAEEAASKYLFSPSSIEKQCGTISIDFKLK